MELSVPTLPRRFLTAEWRHLAMLNFEVDPAALMPYVPPGLELDFFEGRTYLSVVGFRFLNTRVLGLALPWHRNFDEVNLRFYVKREVEGQTRRGVIFIKELVARRLVSFVARVFYNENYLTVPMSSAITLPEGKLSGEARYGWRFLDRPHGLRVAFRGEPRLPGRGAEAEFIVEHYWGYSRQRDGGALEYRVEHPPWRVWPATVCEFDCDARALYGPEFAKALGQAPRSAFVAEGSPVVVRRGRRVAVAENKAPEAGLLHADALASGSASGVA